MIANYSQAVDEINAVFNNEWQTNENVPLNVGYIPEIRWQGNEQKNKPDFSKFWLRHSVQSVISRQSSLSNCESAPGVKKYTSSGLIFIQLFCPKSVANAIVLGRELAQIAQNAYRGTKTENGVWFRNVRIIDLPDENLSYRFNVIAEYEYDELF